MIRVLHNYGGRNTKEQRILPGEYADSDPALFGLAEYLVEHGHAIPVKQDATPNSLAQLGEAQVLLEGGTSDDHSYVMGVDWAAGAEPDKSDTDLAGDPAKEPAPPNKSDKPKRR
jgi:hypothetical protein